MIYGIQGPSQAAKTSFAKQLFQKPFVVTVQNSTTLNLKDFVFMVTTMPCALESLGNFSSFERHVSERCKSTLQIVSLGALQIVPRFQARLCFPSCLLRILDNLNDFQSVCFGLSGHPPVPTMILTGWAIVLQVCIHTQSISLLCRSS